MSSGDEASRTAGWSSSFPVFRETEAKVIRVALSDFIRDASPEQIRAWDQSIPWLQREAGEVLDCNAGSDRYTAILEYQLPLDSRRPDVVVLLRGPVVVMELKGKVAPSQADLDQVAAYARDLRAYHRECEARPVHAVLVPTRADSRIETRDGIFVVGPEGVDALLRQLRGGDEPVTPRAFLDADAYRPLPTLVQAARDLFEHHRLPEIKRARACTEPAVETISRLAHDAARTGTRKLVLVTGVPGSGKTLVGLRAVHARYLDDLSVERRGGKPTSPAVFLSGNGPLVQVLQYQLKQAGGGGQTFVRRVKDYLDAHVPRPDKVPPEHVLVFDEAQRAFTKDMVAHTHGEWPSGAARSEPEHFIEICERIPRWCVLVGLIGGGQEIHKGEEGGLVQWRTALEGCRNPGAWTVHAPGDVEEVFVGSPVRTAWEPSLNLDTEIRFHLTPHLHEFVDGVLCGGDAAANLKIAAKLWRPQEQDYGIHLWTTRDLDVAKAYLRERYTGHRDARFGLIASSKDKVLEKRFGVPNSYQATKRVRLGPWYAEGEDGPDSCRHLETVVTEFGAQGLELDMALLAWGIDLVREDGRWSSKRAGGYRGIKVLDPHQLRVNAYRVLLTRGRDGTVVFVPPLAELDETFAYLTESGFRVLA